MSTSKRVDTNKIHYAVSKVISFSLENTGDSLPEVFEFDEIELERTFTNLIDVEDSVIKIIFEIKLSSKSIVNSDTKLSAYIKTDNIFNVDNIKEIVETKDGIIILDTLVGITLCSLSYSTARGFLLSKFEGTPFQNIILPIVNPAEFSIKQK